MGTESYQFTVFTMLIGMFIVFAAMILFSVMMVVLKALVRGRGGNASGGPGNVADRPGGAGFAEAADGQRPLPAWAMVAVAAYLTAGAEGREGPSAAAWRPEVNQYDPWLAGGQFSKRRAGV